MANLDPILEFLSQDNYHAIALLDIGLVSFLIYRALLVVKGTRAAPMLGGLFIVISVYFVSDKFGLLSLSWLLSNFLSSLILVIVILFQDEIRKGLTKVGLQPIFAKHSRVDNKFVDDLVFACLKMSKTKTGALIVIRGEVGLDDLIEDSIFIDACVDRKLIIALFAKSSPLHDGALIIEDARIKAAGCVLPLSFNPDLDPNLGTRHRASLGISERSDALVIVVSEETGAITVVKDGKMARNLDEERLKLSIESYL